MLKLGMVNTKLYVQLNPDDQAVTALRTVQQQLGSAATRLVPQTALHLTVLHIGLVDRMIQAIRPYSSQSSEQMLQKIPLLVKDLQAVITECAFTQTSLQPNGFDHFGATGTAFVLKFLPTPELTQLHTACLQVLKSFFEICGIGDVTSFMKQDSNFKYALSLKPHLTLAKSYTNYSAAVFTQTVKFHIMPIVY